MSKIPDKTSVRGFQLYFYFKQKQNMLFCNSNEFDMMRIGKIIANNNLFLNKKHRVKAFS